MNHKQRVFVRNMRKHLRQHCRKLAAVGEPHLSFNPEVRDEYQRALAFVLNAGRLTIDDWARYVTARRSNLEPLFSMPPARVKKRKGAAKPQTLVERRATAAASKVKEWQRKAKLAATKVKAYQRKHKYYKRKGVV